MGFYDDAKYGVVQTLNMGPGLAVQTSVIGARVEVERMTMLNAVTIKDWNVKVVTGATCTGGIDFNVAISKSVAGTGDVTPFGSQAITSQADGTVVDATLTETNFDAGDDLVLSHEVGTALPAGAINVGADVSYVQRYT